MTDIDFTPAAVVYDYMFVHYDDNGVVHLISNVEKADKNNFKIALALVEPFLLGKKDFKRFKIDYFFNLSKGIITSEEQVIIKSKKPLYLIPLTTTYSNEVTLDYYKNYWEINISDSALDRLDIVKSLTFFVVKKDDLYYLYRYFTIDAQELKLGPVQMEFITDQEYNLNLISVVTEQKFSSYGIKEMS
jgi:hypothetical protein